MNKSIALKGGIIYELSRVQGNSRVEVIVAARKWRMKL